MSIRVNDIPTIDDAGNASGAERSPTLELNAVKKVVREAWQSKLKEQGTNVDILGKHAAFMNGVLESVDYEVVCMPSVASHTKHMSRGELMVYTKFLETLAVGYKSRFGPEFANLMIAGLALVSKDLRTARSHFDNFVSDLGKISEAYERRSARVSKKIEELDKELGRKQSGMLRFFRKRAIQSIRANIGRHRGLADRFEKRRAKYASIAESLRANTALRPARK